MILTEKDLRIHLDTERDALYSQLRGHTSHRIASAITTTPRENFVDPMQRFIAYDDEVIPVENERYATSVSQPSVVADMLRLLDPRSEDFVIELGAGSGFQAAVLGKLCHHVLAIEIDKGLAENARQRIADLKIRNVEIMAGDAAEVRPGLADKLIVTASLFPDVLSPVFGLLNLDGVCVVPVGGG